MSQKHADSLNPIGSQKDEQFSDLKKDFSHIFFENNLNQFSNANDIGFIDVNKFAAKQSQDEYDDHHGPFDGEKSISNKSLSGAQTPNQHPYKNMSFSPYRGNQNSNSNHNPPLFSLLQPNKGLDSINNTPSKFVEKSYNAYPHYDSMHYESNSNDFKDPHLKQEFLEYPDEPLSLIWANDPKSHKKVPFHSDGFNSLKKNPIPYPAYDSYDESFQHKPHEEPDPYSQIKRDISKFATKIEPKVEHDELVVQPKQKKVSNIVVPVAIKKEHIKRETPSKYSNFDDDDKDDDGDGKNRSSRGLRVLSLKVKDIVNEKKRTSYKEVAETLIKELNKKMKGQGHGSGSKDEQNVKRRVYDALNVLIAADILKKEGKVVLCDESVANLGIHRRKKMKEEKEQLEHEILDLRKKNRHKIEHIQELVFKLLAVKNLIARNKSHGEPKSTPTKTGLQQPSNEDLIHFPFLVVVNSASDYSMNLNMSENKKIFGIESKNQFNIFGDIDVLLKMKMHYVPKKFFEENISPELLKYIPPSYIDSLKQ